ncbi:MAG TPA: metalloregulator ArsR/SmtB family transcription factor [Anaerolineales bacterium]|nr:metalloregulator ArsR/SmtB family transcription factor [Anaerolineales bacterium]
MTDPRLKLEVTQLHAELCSALAEPSRILLLYALSQRAYTVNDLSLEVGISQSATSRHLKVLRSSGLVLAERRGQMIEYRLRDSRIIQALDLLREILHDRLAYKFF